MHLEQFYLGCLAHASYLVGSEGVAAVIDPQRDVDVYLQTASRLGLRVAHVIETHLHADFVSGHRELAERTGAQICLGEGSGAAFPHLAVRDGHRLCFGRCVLEILQTPGHTVESICLLLTDLDRSPAPWAAFTGDTLFVGDVGRPDLSPNHTPQQLAGLLYDSLHGKLLKLPDEIEIFPAHGAGSLCGRQMGSERSSTIGRERRFNYALQARTREEFIHLLTDSLPPRPEYFGRDVELNRQGAAPLETLPPPQPLSAAEVRQLQSGGAVVLDTRPLMEFAVAHVPGSVHVALSGQFASWAARLIGLDRRIVLVASDQDQLRESRMRLARVGMERVVGCLGDGVAGWIRGGQDLDYIPQITVQEFAELRRNEPLTVLDVREPGEVAAGAIDGSIRIPLGSLAGRAREIAAPGLLVVHCKGGYRSSIATSLLRRAGFRDIANLTGGYDAWQASEAARPAAPPAAASSPVTSPAEPPSGTA
jgi:glyoxylase-like metal-dependent hydrolase (beta-lactamase superfamily II)/rhodanese-related sulfurtransferase